MPRSDIPLLLEPQQLSTLLSGTAASSLVLVDLSSPDNYTAGHIPGALYVHPGLLQRGTAPAPGK